MNIDIYTDGACKGNPGNGGYGWIILIGNNKYYHSYGVLETTNNRMELSSAISALKELYKILYNANQQEYNITIYTDSAYICNAINKKWLDKWFNEDFKKIKNSELWKEFKVSLVNLNRLTNSDIKFEWVKGHNGNEYNEEADQLACLACNEVGIVLEGNQTIIK